MQSSPVPHHTAPIAPFALIAAAGTGGHIMPGLAIATELQKQNWHVAWLGTKQGMENTLVPPQGFVLHRLAFAGLRGKGIFGLLKGGLQLLLATKSCVQLMRQLRPKVLIGMGGYICVPAAWAAWLCNVPVVLVNADADLLLSNQKLARFAQAICCGFEGLAAQLPHAVVTGNPIRAAVANLALPPAPSIETRYHERTGALNILIMGGSLGAQILNETVPAALALLKKHTQLKHTELFHLNLNIWHQTGAKQYDQTQAAYAKQSNQDNQDNQDGITVQTIKIVPFIEDMAQAYAWADVVICRAGAITISELCAAGVPAILVPLLAKTTHHQAGNAAYLAKAGAAIHLPQADLTVQQLASTLEGLTRERLLVMAQAALTLAKPHATQAVVSVIKEVIKKPLR